MTTQVIENYTTKIAASRTSCEIQDLLVRHGAQQIMLDYADGRMVGITFSIDTDFGPRLFRLPVDVDAIRPPRRPAFFSLARIWAWRVVKDWLAAQLTLVAARMAKLDQVMLPYLLVNGQPLYSAYRDQQLALTAGEGGE